MAQPLLRGATEQSAALTMFRRTRLSTAQQRIPVLSALPTAYFVNGDTGLKQTTEIGWANKFLNVEEIAAIVPIPEAVLDDSSFDVWGEVRPLLEEAVGRTLDAAVFFGVNKPSSWPTDVVASAIAAGNVLTRGTNAAAAGGIAQDISDVMGLVEADGYDANGAVALRTYRSRARSNRDTTGRRLDDITATDWFGTPVRYPMRGLWPTGAAAAEAVLGDFGEGIMGIRADVTYKILDQAVITDNTNAIIFNLAQQDMVALRIVARFAWQVANIINFDNAVEATRFPFAVLRAP